MSDVRVLLGPPGTGKTTTLLNRIEGLLQEGVAPDDIAFVSFTKAACIEAKERAIARFDFDDEQLPNFRTVHSMAVQMMGGNRTEVMEDRHWKAFGESCRFEFSSARVGLAETPFFSAFETDGDQIRQIFDLSRLCRCTIERAMLRLSRLKINVKADQVVAYARRLAEFKKEHELIDFTDMLERALVTPRKPSVTHAFVDEAQDLCPLQHELVRHWFLESDRCERVTLAGDDDQAIFTWAGADPDALIEAARKYPCETLKQSYRIPRLVHALAMRIVNQNHNRVVKAYNSRDEDGVISVERGAREAVRDLTGPALALVRNIKFADDFYAEAMANAMIFSAEVGPKAPLDRAGVREAYEAIALLREGKQLRPSQFSEMLELVPSKVDGKPFLPHGVKAKADRNTALVNQYRAVEEFGLADFLRLVCADGPCSRVLLRLSAEDRRYLDRVLAREGSRLPESQLTITTQHRSKGRESDTVIVYSDMARASHDELVRGDRESENRTAYVAATRTKRELRLVQPQTNRSYPFTSFLAASGQ